ncbi:hypothetical protein Pla8534_28420 [Lignipirellula cremea]|uniref:Uncharacterized protein n=1 Tax=Lignipirellula cremea TaxID=2528010 RepID=A0A518DT64_9BACT|nr:hypothetical protein Pla8534_28420 [Lignipirellula cremea]
MNRFLVPAVLAAATICFAGTNASAFNLFGGCGCNAAPSCCAPSCGCNAAPSCGCNVAPTCGCEPSCCDSGCGHRHGGMGLFKGLFGHKRSHGCCDSGCDSCGGCEPSCGCNVAPSCGCNAAPSCGCAPTCGCEPSCCGSSHSCGFKGHFKKMFSGFGHRHHGCCDSGCCGAEPSCGCNVAPSCGCNY